MTEISYPSTSMSVEDYLRFEEASPERHEYVAGHVYAMTGGTLRHNRLSGRIYAALLAASGDGPCGVFVEAVKLRAANDRIYYPDVMVVCTPVDLDAQVVRDPCLAVEVLSPGTRRTDRGEKLDTYRAIPSLRTYLIVEQTARLVDRYWRDQHGDWQHETISDAERGGAIPVPCPEATLTLDAIYRGILPEGDDSRPPLRVREEP
jgi:Uma2 family endonuclease